jgi:lysozyme
MIHEGFRSKPYQCTMGKLTIGFGFNLEALEMPVEVALYWLEILVEETDKILHSNIPYYDELSDNRKAVLINMAFNLGIDGLLKFRKTLEYLAKKKYVEASQEMLKSIWASQVGYRANELSEQMKRG